jgi:hypothetical protein
MNAPGNSDLLFAFYITNKTAFLLGRRFSSILLFYLLYVLFLSSSESSCKS